MLRVAASATKWCKSLSSQLSTACVTKLRSRASAALFTCPVQLPCPLARSHPDPFCPAPTVASGRVVTSLVHAADSFASLLHRDAVVTNKMRAIAGCVQRRTARSFAPPLPLQWSRDFRGSCPQPSPGALFFPSTSKKLLHSLHVCIL